MITLGQIESFNGERFQRSIAAELEENLSEISRSKKSQNSLYRPDE